MDEQDIPALLRRAAWAAGYAPRDCWDDSKDGLVLEALAARWPEIEAALELVDAYEVAHDAIENITFQTRGVFYEARARLNAARRAHRAARLARESEHV